VQAATKAEYRGSLSLWTALLAGPLAWITNLVLGSEIPELMCAPGASQDVLGLSIEAFIVGATALLAGIAVGGGVLAFRCWRASKGDGTTGRRASWMSVAGIMTNVLFLILILPGLAPSFFLSQCGRGL
jgi:hypothetical protein